MNIKKYLLSFVLFLLAAIGCLAKNSVSPMTVGNVFVKLNDSQAFAPVKFMNWGDTEVKSIMYTLLLLSGKTQKSIKILPEAP